MSDFSARTLTPRLRTASFGVEGWTVNTIGFESMDDMRPLYSSEDHPSMLNSSPNAVVGRFDTIYNMRIRR